MRAYGATWVDDLAFSGDDPRRIIPVVIGALRKTGLRLSRKKIRIMGPATRKLLNGIVLGKKLGVTREVRSRIRAGIHRLATGAIPLQDQPKYLRSLIARLRQAETINPSQLLKLRVKLKAVLNQKSISLAQRQYFLKQLA